MKHSLATSRLLSHTGIVSCSPEHLSLSDGSREVADDSREVAVHIEFDIEKKLKKWLRNCCKEHLSGNFVHENSDFSYFQILSRRELIIPSIHLLNYVCTAFVILDYSVDVITQIGSFYRRILCHFSSDNFDQYTCSIHESIRRCFYNHAVANIFLNNKIKLSNDSALPNGVKAFKMSKLP